MGILSAGKCLYLYLCLLYKALVNISQKWKVKEDVREEKTSLVQCMRVLVPKNIEVSCMEGRVLSHGDDVWSFVLWGLGSLCKISDVLQLSVFHIIFCSGTHQSSLVGVLLLIGCQDQCPWVSVSSHACILSRFLDKIPSCRFITVHVWGGMYASWWGYL